MISISDNIKRSMKSIFFFFLLVHRIPMYEYGVYMQLSTRAYTLYELS